MQIHIETVTVDGKQYRPIKTFAGYTLAQQVIDFRKDFEEPYKTLSDHYTLLSKTAVIAESSSKEFPNLVEALQAFKVA
jgi:hypothetical protein